MRAVILDVESVINSGIENGRRRLDAALEALHHTGCRTTQKQFNDALQEMRDSHADQPDEAALWQLFRGFALEQGMDQRRRAREWDALVRDFRGLSGYRFEERSGIRKLIEDLRFATTDLQGDVPRLAAVSDRGNWVIDALDHAKLTVLFDVVELVTDAGPRSGDARFLESLLKRLEVSPQETLVAGLRIGAFLGPARALGCFGVRLVTEVDGGMPARGIWEEPDREVYSISELGDCVFDWLNAPVAMRRRTVK